MSQVVVSFSISSFLFVFWGSFVVISVLSFCVYAICEIFNMRFVDASEYTYHAHGRSIEIGKNVINHELTHAAQ